MSKAKAVKKIPNSMKQLLACKICDDHIEAGGKRYFFLRIKPKNMTILSYQEKEVEIKKFQAFLDSIDTEFSIFVMDKTENLDDIKHYYEMLVKSRPDYEFINGAVLEKLQSIESDSACVQRAFYIIMAAKERRDYDLFVKQLAGHINFSLVFKEELIVIMQNYQLHEYPNFSLYSFENEIEKEYRKMLKTRGGPKVRITDEAKQRFRSSNAVKKITPVAPAAKDTPSNANTATAVPKTVEEEKTVYSNKKPEVLPVGKEKIHNATDTSTEKATNGERDNWPFG